MMKKYKGMSVREDVAEKIQAKAKEEGKPISTILNELLGSKKKEEGVLTEVKMRQIIREEVTAILEEARRW